MNNRSDRGPNLLNNPTMVKMLGLDPETQKSVKNNVESWANTFNATKKQSFFEAKFEYTIDARFIHYPIPAKFDNWGMDEHGNSWDYSFCVMDDFGNAVMADPFAYPLEDTAKFLAPDYDPSTPVGEAYKYIVYYPTLH